MSGQIVNSNLIVQGIVCENALANHTFNSACFNFTAQTPSTPLVVGANTITLNPCPLGVNGTDVRHYLYISGGVGTAEPILITGGTCTSGAKTGTITFTAANTHSGVWTIATGTAGIQEALQAAGQLGAVKVPSGSQTIYAKISCPFDSTLQGSGKDTTFITPSGFSTRAIECVHPIGAIFNIQDLTVAYVSGTSQEGIYLEDIADSVIQNVGVWNAYDGITGYSTARVYFNNITMLGIKHNGFNFSSNPASSVTAVTIPFIIGGLINLVPVGANAVIYLGSTIAGGQIIGLNTIFGDYGIQVADATNGVINELNIVGCTFDTYGIAGISANFTTNTTMQRWTVTSNLFAGGSGTSFGLVFATTTPGNINDLTLTANKILVNSASGIGLNIQGTLATLISGNVIKNATAGGYGILLDGTSNTNMVIAGNISGVANGVSDVPAFAHGIYINNQAHTGIRVNGNYIKGSSDNLTNLSTAGTGAVIGWDVATVTVPNALFASLPTYTLASNVLGTAILVPLDAATHTVPTNDTFSHIRLSQTDGSDNIFTIGSGASVQGLASYVRSASGSDATSALYAFIANATNVGPGTVKAFHANAVGSGTSSGVLVAVNAQITPVATSSTGSASVQIALASSGINDIATGINFTSTGDRYNYGIGSPVAAVSYNQAFLMAWMATGSAAGADFLRLLNNAGTTIYHVDKSGNVFAQTVALRDTSAAFDVTLQATSSTALTAGRILTIDMKDAAHTFALGATAGTLTFPLGTKTIPSTADNLSVFAATTSAQLAGVLSDETGTGVAVFGTSPQFTTSIGVGSSATVATAQLVKPAGADTVGGSLILDRNATSGAAGTYRGGAIFSYYYAANLGGHTDTLSFATTSSNSPLDAAHVHMVLDEAGSLCVNCTAPVAALTVVGTATITAIASSGAAQSGYLCYNTAAPGTITYDGGATCLVSREEYKDIIGPINDAMAIITQLKPFWGAYKDTSPMTDHNIQPFLGARQVASVDYRLVSWGDDKEPLGVRYENLPALLISGMQELDARIKKLEAK